MGQYNSEPDSICDSAASVAVAIPILRAQPALAITCQGYDLGYQGGFACILSFATIERPSQVFHFDLITLNRVTLQPLFDILRSPSVTKAVFDGRLIASALLHQWDVELVNALDMQLADVTSRKECAERQLSRLSDVDHDSGLFLPDISRSIVHAHPEWYQSLIRLNEAETCTKEHGIEAGSSVWRRLIEHTAEVWAARPLSSWACKYSTDRVYLISAIYGDFKDKGYITPALAAQSARYLSLHRAQMPKLGSGHSFPILPLGIITAMPPARTRLCKTCGRAFIEGDTREDDGVYCLVCFAVNKAQEENDEISRRIAAMPPLTVRFRQ
ncbi:3'-5' exonuclease domain-containing protein [Mycena venus]|uniref:3'-5' exonuclease domain-containing protein n=1 Tax=Mycena venus TaxID=2733690 RepID=A0A8H7D1G6_9AGAR|nr:3'-5' exonuclease domain-containing protein [Mycena venus]